MAPASEIEALERRELNLRLLPGGGNVQGQKTARIEVAILSALVF
jgi:hypothetical protein